MLTVGVRNARRNGGIMPNREALDDTLQRVGLACLMWHPAIAVDEPGYELVTDVDWCLEPVRDLVEDQRDRLREAIGRTSYGADLVQVSRSQ
jgi:hypothetical protein